MKRESKPFREVVIVGAGGLAREIRWLLSEEFLKKIVIDDGQYQYMNFIGFVDSKSKESKKNNEIQIAGNDIWLSKRRIETDVFFGIGTPSIVKKVAEKISPNKLLNFPSVIHPKTVLGDVEIGIGCLITVGCVLTVNISMGNFNIVNLNTTIGHDVEIGNYNLFNPGTHISGKVKIGNTCLFGTGCRVLENLTIADNTIIGAGAVVTKSIIEPGGTYVGVPAVKLK